MQFKCEQSLDVINSKREKGLMVATLTCVCGLLFLLVIHYFNVTAGYDFQKWDLETVTAGDFTVEITIDEEQWN